MTPSALLASLNLPGPPLSLDGLGKVLRAQELLLAVFIEERAGRLAKRGGKASARQLRIVAQDIRAGLWGLEDGC